MGEAKDEDRLCIKSGSYEFLTGCAAYRIDYQGERWPTVQHAYEAEKFTDPIIRKTIWWAASPEDAVLISKRQKKRRRPDWDEEMKVATKERLMHLLITQHPRLRERLLATGTMRIVFRSPSYFWGVSKSGKGLNEHGKLLMRIREHERQYEYEAAAE